MASLHVININISQDFDKSFFQQILSDSIKDVTNHKIISSILI